VGGGWSNTLSQAAHQYYQQEPTGGEKIRENILREIFCLTNSFQVSQQFFPE